MRASEDVQYRKWGSLKSWKEREALLDIVGADTMYSKDYIAMFVKRTKRVDFYIVKYGIRTIWERGWDEEWYDVYNWNILLFAREKSNEEYEQIDGEEFLTYEEAQEAMKKFMVEYPRKYFEEKVEEEGVEFPSWAKSIVSRALMEVNLRNSEKVKEKLSGTALCTNPKLLRKAHKLIDLKVQMLRKSRGGPDKDEGEEGRGR